MTHSFPLALLDRRRSARQYAYDNE